MFIVIVLKYDIEKAPGFTIKAGNIINTFNVKKPSIIEKENVIVGIKQREDSEINEQERREEAIFVVRLFS